LDGLLKKVTILERVGHFFIKSKELFTMNQDELKKKVGFEAATYVENDMIVGLGSGTTIKYLVKALGDRVLKEQLKITCVSTSQKTAELANQLGISTTSIDNVKNVDLTIDGADEISKNFYGIKGGGAALLWEKIVAENSDQNMWIVDESKLVDQLGKFPLPVEVIPFGSSHVLKKFEDMGLKPKIRKNKASALIRTDSNNYIIDLHIGKIYDPQELALELNNTVGVVEHGLFLDVVNRVLVGTQTGVETMQRGIFA
jgi:ribose 5-phosphate isomerase A